MNEKKKILFIINTCFRYKEVIRLMSQIREYSGLYNITIYLNNDGSPAWMNQYIVKWINENKNDRNFEILYNQFEESHLKYKYFKLVHQTFQFMKYTEADYYFMLPDDAILSPDYVNEAICQWEMIDDEKKICLNLFTDQIRHGTMNWQCEPQLMCYPDTDNNLLRIWKSGWVDMEFICERKFFEQLNYSIDDVNPIRWKRNPFLGSGVGQQISDRLRNKGFSLYQVDESLSWTNHADSVMNSSRNFSIVPFVNMKKYHPESKVIVHMATIKSRRKSLENTVASLMMNTIMPDKIHIYLNDYDEIPLFAVNNPERFVIHSNPNGDLADNAKFYQAVHEDSYVFHCDDDLVYPENYISYMINQIEFNERKVIVTAHGARLTSIEPVDYYQERETFTCLGEVRQHEYCHIAGTGVVAYHSDTFFINLTHFPTQFMADIHFAIQSNKHKIPILCVSHSYGWIKETEEIKELRDTTIYERFRNDTGEQCKFIREFKGWGIWIPEFIKLEKQSCQLLQK